MPEVWDEGREREREGKDRPNQATSAFASHPYFTK